MSQPDLAIRDVLIFDGSGTEPIGGDVEIDGGRITAVGTARAAKEEIDGKGRALAPGFIDVHTHDDGAVLLHPELRFKVAQGCTSLVVGNCGFSALPGSLGGSSGILDGVGEGFNNLDEYFAAVTAARPALNVISQVGHNSLRFAAMGNERRAPTTAELDLMRGGVEAAMAQGAIGLSSGLIYQPGRYSETEELITLAQISGAYGGLYNTHMRNEGDRLLEAVAEAIRIGAEAGVGVNISHHKAAMPRNWGKVVDSLALIDQANANGQDISLDIYPYIAGSGPMAQYFDLQKIDLELAAAIRLASCPALPAYEGRHLTEIATETGEGLDTLVTRILTAKAGRRTICIQFLMTEADVETNLHHPRVMIGSDGIPDLEGRPHPRLYGTFPRVLGHYVRERGVLPLAEAIRRMTSLSADRFGLVDRGRVQVGGWADLVLFDPATVIDTATWDDPQLEPAGISHVLVNGVVALVDGRHNGNRAGRPLRYRQPS